jgi:glycosyltransferase involved in cell wall biosynthesis
MQVLPEARIRIVPNGVDTDTYYPARTRSPGPRVRILCVARLVERKGQRLAIKALAAIRTLGVDAELMLVGDGDSLASYKEFAHACGVGEHVMFRGALSRAEMPDAYRDADIFLLPSFAESMSVAALEALASGLPLVVTQGGGADLFVEHGRNGFLIPYGDVEALTAAIHELANSSELRAQYASESRRKSGQFSWSATTQGLLNALREVSKS